MTAGAPGVRQLADVVPLLAVETATTLVGAAVVWRLDGEGGRPEVHAVGHEGGREHAELLAPAIAQVCGTDGLAAVRCVAVDVGPGRFTGLRVGVATAKALGQALGVGVLGVRSTDVLAWAATEWLAHAASLDLTGGWPPVAVAVDARRGEVFAATYDLAPGVVPGLGTGDATPVRVVAPEAWAAEVEAVRRRSGRVVVAGDGALRYLDRLASVDGVHVAAGPDGSPLGAPLPRALALLALDRLARGEEVAASASVVPEYGREADARVNWAQRIAPPVATAPGAGRGPGGATR
ncbi:MAG: tRNA (adenosine(37)-N6)-threonylcarbamoyltransferase complex dimerization subunit type 1 TsaB [Actinomycetota bacterium]|nr:tRNA (adenosine(37)-N6)-threonylcarbamoyltransferase complex dimerization subunit type 1 TsaB [Actinomycetota bacterium]